MSNSAGCWTVDSGATHHTTLDESKVVNGVDYNGPGAKESCNSLHDTGQQGSKLTIVDKIYRKNTPQPTLNDARVVGASSESQEDLQGHDGEVSTAVQQEPGVNTNQPHVDHSLGHAQQGIGVSFAGGELESGQVESDNPINDEGFYETIPEEEANQESTDADQITEMVLSSEQATNQSNNMSSNSAFNPDMGEDVTLSSQQDDVVPSEENDRLLETMWKLIDL
ncbi:hypothetical protein V6N12_062675 [Hibiscus sabdariffa]|uniref:Uncharacterized protein n=1 Tax=Hibiscus sabdariffa TaxID=183260 RepID=A0ABR2F9K9_9ROSI